MITRRTLLQSALLLPVAPRLLARSASAQEVAPSNAPWLEQLARQLQKEFNLPAVWVAVNVEDQIEAAVVGVKNINAPTPATLDDKLTLASVSKPMAGLWIAALVDAGKMTYETKVLDVLPQLKPSCLPEHHHITLGELLLHTAGVARDVKSPRNSLGLEQYPAERLRQARELLSQPSPPGSKGEMLYSNSGVTLAVTMAERVVGEPYESAAGRFYRERLELKSWGVWGMNLPEDLTLPWPHLMGENGPVPVSPRSYSPRLVRPSGGAHSTIADLVRFGLLATNATELSKTLLSQGAWNMVLEPQANTRDTLLSFSVDDSRARYSHNGSFPGVRSRLLCIPFRKVSVAIHINVDSGEAPGRGTSLIMDAVRQQHKI